MSFVRSIMGFFGGAANGAASDAPTKLALVVDMNGFFSGNGQRERPSPRDQFALLQQVAKFAEKEALSVSVVIDGRPLREAPDGKHFKSVAVYYVEQSGQIGERVLALAGRGRGAVVITQNREIERQARERGVSTLRNATFRKGMEETESSAGSGRSGGRGRRRQRPRRNAGSRSDERNTAPKNEQRSQKEAPKDGVSDLIDLV